MFPLYLQSIQADQSTGTTTRMFQRMAELHTFLSKFNAFNLKTRMNKYQFSKVHTRLVIMHNYVFHSIFIDYEFTWK